VRGSYPTPEAYHPLSPFLPTSVFSLSLARTGFISGSCSPLATRAPCMRMPLQNSEREPRPLIPQSCHKKQLEISRLLKSPPSMIPGTGGFFPITSTHPGHPLFHENFLDIYVKFCSKVFPLPPLRLRIGSSRVNTLPDLCCEMSMHVVPFRTFLSRLAPQSNSLYLPIFHDLCTFSVFNPI